MFDIKWLIRYYLISIANTGYRKMTNSIKFISARTPHLRFTIEGNFYCVYNTDDLHDLMNRFRNLEFQLDSEMSTFQAGRNTDLRSALHTIITTDQRNW